MFMKRVFFAVLAVFLSVNVAVASASYKRKLLPPFASTVVDRNGKVIGYFYEKNFRLYSPFSEIPKNLIYAVISAEDARFYEHKGVDPMGILRAVVKDVTSGRIVQGGSTITQQLAKMIFLSPERTITRKFKEIGIAKELEEKLTKNEILELYLNYVYLGSGAYGVKSAALTFFGKPLKDLTVSQCALLAALIKGPGYYNPFRYPRRAIQRRNWVLSQMRQNGYISKSTYIAAKNEQLGILPSPKKPRVAGYDLDFVKFMLKRIISSKDINRRGLTIKTTLDSDVQKFAQGILSKYNGKYRKRSKISDIQCAGMAMSRLGEVIFIVGGDDYKKTKLNRAFQILRPIGSTAKPITYLSAFEEKISPYDLIENSPVELPKKIIRRTRKGKRKEDYWRPRNYSSSYSKYVEVKEGLVNSINLATLHLAMKVTKKVKLNFRKFEFTDGDFNLSYVLGSFPSNLYRILRAFSAIQSGGVLYRPYVISEISDKGKLLYKGTSKFKKVADKENISILRVLMQDVVKEGTARRISYLLKRFDIAGKTGTTNNWRDAYFTGFTTSYLMSIWYGRDSYKTLWKGADGGKLSASPWAEISQKLCSIYGCGKFMPPQEAVEEEFPLPSLPVESDADTFITLNSISSLPK